jgi:ribosomal protein S18 acetylase RimI-like enzyme
MYLKEMYFFKDNKPKKGVIRSYRENDFEQLIEIQKESFPPPFPSELWWNEEQLYNHITYFPQGAICAEVDGRLVGSITGLRVRLNGSDEHSWEEVTDNGYITNHDPNGNTLYIVDVCIRPSDRSLGIGKWLMQSMYDVVVHERVERLLGGGRMPGYHNHFENLTPEEYIRKVMLGELSDPVISFLLRCGRSPIGIVQNYLQDEESLNYGVLMEWKNPFIGKDDIE